MFENNGQFNFGGYNAGGFNYAPQQNFQPPVFNQLLNQEEIAKLQKAPAQFSTRLTEDEFLRSVCTHKQNNQIALEALPNGKHRCPICGTEFFLLDLNTSESDVEQMCANFHDVMESIKTYYGNIPENMREFFMMIGFIKKVPYLWKVARAYFEKVVGQTGMLQANSDQNGFAMLGNIFGNGAMGGMFGNMGGGMPMGGYYTQQQMSGYAPQYQQQGYVGQPMQQVPGMGAYQVPQQPMMQPAMNGPVPVQQPQFAQPAYGMGGMMQPQQPQAMMGNPIGYVDPTANQKDFTQQQPVQQQAQPVQQQPAAPMPEPPKNPNVKDKATVSKNFAG
nr:MAG TPA: zinc-ribbon domain protein [Caudoviricetes sp.]